MNDALKQRLVGGITLFLFGVIFIPLILDGPPPGRFEEAAKVEASPSGEDDIVTFKPPPPPARVSVSNGEAQGTVPSTPPVSPAPSPVSQPKAEMNVSGWIVQVGIFSAKSNADSLIKKLSKKGFDAHSERLDGRKGPVYRVYVGPLANRDSANRTRTSIHALFGMKGLVKKRG